MSDLTQPWWISQKCGRPPKCTILHDVYPFYIRWERGDITFLYRGDLPPDKALTVMDNKANVYQFVRHQESELEFEDEVDLLMSSDIVAAQISTKPISFSRERQGWIWREDRAETLGNYRF